MFPNFLQSKTQNKMHEENMRIKKLLVTPKSSQLQNISSTTISLNENICFSTCFHNPVNMRLAQSYFILKTSENNQTEIFLLPLSLQLHFNIIYEEESSSVIKTFQLKHNNIPICQFVPENHENIKQMAKVFRKRLISSNCEKFFSKNQRIGKGSFATVYVVQRLKTRKKFAAKVFEKLQLKGEKGQKAIINEINLLRMLNHKRIPSLKGVYAAGNSIAVIMDHIQGCQLHKFIQNYKYDDEIQLKQFMRSLLKTLKYLHKLRIVHRDISLRNIIISGDKLSNLFLIDFGLATYCDIPQYIHNFCGTPGYIPPEVFLFSSNQQFRVQPSWDIFSAAAIFFKVITGTSLIPQKNSAEVKQISKKFNEEYLQNKMVAEDFPEGPIKELLFLMLKGEPKARITAEEALNLPLFSLNKQNNSEKRVQVFQGQKSSILQ